MIMTSLLIEFCEVYRIDFLSLPLKAMVTACFLPSRLYEASLDLVLLIQALLRISAYRKEVSSSGILGDTSFALSKSMQHL